jgi:2-polyprenyl-3-methyl-5-hydroxy-6-metoxy-1,4-benzoquinol methylase
MSDPEVQKIQVPFSMANRSFDAHFYQRFYMNPRTRVTTREEMARRAGMVAALVKQLELPVKRILDAGCGLGWLRAPLLEAFPGATYVGLEVSEHLCRQHGWVQQSLAAYRPRGLFDLLVCYDVMQYLSDREAASAMANLSRLSRGALYFHAPTLEDWRDNADLSTSDGDVNLRNAEWYRTRLARHFVHAGFGVHVRRGVPWAQWELERSV